MLRSSLVLVLVAIYATYTTAKEVTDKNAIVTLVTGPSSGYASGAIALGQSIIDVGSKLRRIVMVTPDVDEKVRSSMKHIWEVYEVQPIACNHKSNLDPKLFDLNGEKYKAGIQRWSATCTKFAAFSLTQFERIIFMDSDMLVVSPIDDAIYGFSNASFLASPETFPPDNFNSGFLVLNPSKANFDKIMKLNKDVGSAEGGDQGVFNNGLCPNWHYAGKDDPECGRLPWLFNVEAAHYEKYNTLRKMSDLRPPAVVHFVSDGKPWVILALEYQEASWGEIPDSTLMMIGDQTVPHILWRNAFFKAVGEAPPSNTLLSKAHALAAKKGTKIDKNNLKNIAKKAQKKTGKSRKSFLSNKKEKATSKEKVKKGDDKTEATARRRRASVLKKSGNKKAKDTGATAGNAGMGKKGRKGRGRKLLNADKSKSVKKDEL